MSTIDAILIITLGFGIAIGICLTMGLRSFVDYSEDLRMAKCLSAADYLKYRNMTRTV